MKNAISWNTMSIIGVMSTSDTLDPEEWNFMATPSAVAGQRLKRRTRLKLT
jgi:hypothetical protein